MLAMQINSKNLNMNHERKRWTEREILVKN